jgi:hypothetical protein
MHMVEKEARRDYRYPAAISVTIVSRSPVTVVTENVSYRGMFLRTKEHPPKMQLLRVRIAVPTMHAELDTNVVVMMSCKTELGAKVSGVGVQFFGLDGEPRMEWEKYIAFLRDENIALRIRETNRASKPPRASLVPRAIAVPRITVV